MAESAGERTEQPTDRRKRDARKKGTVTKSVDLVGALVWLALLIAIPAIFRMGYLGFIEGFKAAVTTSSTELTVGGIQRVTKAAMFPILPALAMLMSVAMIVGVAGNVAQVGFAFSPEAMKPSFQKLNPMNGFKRLFGKPAIFDAFKGIVKLFLFSFLVWTSLLAHWERLGMLWTLSPSGSFVIIGEVARTVSLRIGIAWLVLAAVDYMFQRQQVLKQLKMTKEEVKQEYKDAETSPELKGAIARKRRQIMKMRTSEAVKSADVIITNPTHFAIAIQYQQNKHHAPIVVAKGVDHLALRIREMAAEAKIPVVENVPLARALYKQCEIGDFVPRELFAGVAEVLAYVYRSVKKVRR